ncbi:MAG: hypothetical protein DRO67_03605 [Candidatus Asgardarchaeum californiense]|nr:MAG: hypothetical protein DRO67_03605 [Candidatus Asgardarchaeum californiense]
MVDYEIDMSNVTYTTENYDICVWGQLPHRLHIPTSDILGCSGADPDNDPLTAVQEVVSEFPPDSRIDKVEIREMPERWKDYEFPVYPRTISRGPYEFTVENEEQEALIKKFLGIDPPGPSIDEHLATLDEEELKEWRNYWKGEFSSAGMGEAVSFVDEKYNEYAKEEKPKIYGYVKDQDGNPIEGAKVSSGGINPTYTNSGGYYEYSTEPAVSIKIDVEKEGYNSVSEWVNVGTENVRKDFVLTKEVEAKHNRIYGIVKDKTLGTPISLAAVTFGGKTAYTGNNGKYEIKDVFYSGQIVCSATGYNAATKYIEAPSEGDLEVNFELERTEAPQIDISPIAPPLQGMDKELSAANEIAKQQLDAAKTQGEIPEPAIETALRQVGLDDWADKYHEIYEWLNDNFGIEVPDPHDPTKKRKVIILTAGFAGGLGGLASKLGLNTAKGALTRAGGAIAATIGGLKASSILKGITGIVGTVVFAEFICEEAVQAASMGIYTATQTRDPEVVRQALENYKNILDATKQIHDTVKYIDPIGSTFEAFFTAAENNITNYEKLIERLEDKEKYKKELSKTDILKAYKEELIDEDTAKNKLRALNYTDEDIELMLNMSAKEKLGKLRVTSKPTHAQIIINDNPVDLLTSETIELPPGTYAVTVSLEGYKIPDAKEVTIEEEGRAEVHFDLERMKIGYLSLRSRPSQAAIYINGVDTKLLTPQKFELEEGTYTITLKYNGYEDREIEVEIKENETVERFVRLVRKT